MKSFFKKNKVLRKNKDFSDEDRMLFVFNSFCFKCGRNSWNVLHHILGGNFEEADSPLNACPICNYPCHIGGGHTFSKEDDSKFLNKTFFYLYSNSYQFTPKDKIFIKNNLDLYLKNKKYKKIIMKVIS